MEYLIDGAESGDEGSVGRGMLRRVGSRHGEVLKYLKSLE